MNTTMNIQQPTPSGISYLETIVLVGTLILSIVQFYHLYLKQKSETPSQEKIKDFYIETLKPFYPYLFRTITHQNKTEVWGALFNIRKHLKENELWFYLPASLIYHLRKTMILLEIARPNEVQLQLINQSYQQFCERYFIESNNIRQLTHTRYWDEQIRIDMRLYSDNKELKRLKWKIRKDNFKLYTPFIILSILYVVIALNYILYYLLK